MKYIQSWCGPRVRPPNNNFMEQDPEKREVIFAVARRRPG